MKLDYEGTKRRFRVSRQTTLSILQKKIADLFDIDSRGVHLCSQNGERRTNMTFLLGTVILFPFSNQMLIKDGRRYVGEAAQDEQTESDDPALDAEFFSESFLRERGKSRQMGLLKCRTGIWATP